MNLPPYPQAATFPQLALANRIPMNDRTALLSFAERIRREVRAGTITPSPAASACGWSVPAFRKAQP